MQYGENYKYVFFMCVKQVAVLLKPSIYNIFLHGFHLDNIFVLSRYVSGMFHPIIIAQL